MGQYESLTHKKTRKLSINFFQKEEEHQVL